MVKRNILIALPIDHSSLILVHKLLEDVDNEVTVYIDQGIQNDFMSHVVDDLRSHSTTDIKMTSSQDWTAFEYIVFPNTNVLPSQSDAEFGVTMRNLFRKHLDRVALNPNTVAFFGQNYRGLIAAREISEVHPQLKGSIFVFSSIFAASVHVYGEDGGRHLPDRSGSYFTTGSLAETDAKMVAMEGKWSFGQFQLSEAKALFQGITDHIDNEGELQDTELVGKYPSEIEAETFDISSDIPVFMNGKDLSENYTKYLKNSNGYFQNNYKINE